MATETQTKLVGFCLGNKTNYSATTYANHIWFDPTNKQILLNGIEYIPKKLSELVNDKNFLTSITKSMVENVLTGNITSHTHSYLPLSGGTMSNTNLVTNLNADLLDGYHASNLVKFYLSPMSSGAPADSAKSWFIDTMPAGTGAIVYNVPGSEKTIIAGKSTGAYGHMLQLNYDDNYLRILRYWAGNWKTTDWEKISAGYADTATALTSSAGKATQPIYFSNGKPVACSYTLAKSVPSNAVFTDTTYSVATASADGLMSAAMFKAQMVKSVGIKQGAEMMKPDGTITITDHRVYITQDKSNINGVYQQAIGENDVKIPNATKDYDGSMSYTDKRKLDGISPYAAKKVVALRLSFNADATVTVISGGGDYDMTQDAELMGSKYVEQTSTNNLYLTTFSLDLAAASNDTLNQLFNNNFVKFSFMGKDTSYVPNTVDVKSSFDGDGLCVVFSSLDSQETWVVDCVWEFF